MQGVWWELRQVLGVWGLSLVLRPAGLWLGPAVRYRGDAGLFRLELSLFRCCFAAFRLLTPVGMTKNSDSCLTRFHSQRESALRTWLEANARLPSVSINSVSCAQPGERLWVYKGSLNAH